MHIRSNSPIIRYGIALLATAAGVAVRAGIDPWMGDFLPLPTMYAAVAVAVWFGGYGPGIVTCVAGFFACDYLFIPPRHTFGPHVGTTELIGLSLYLISCGIIITFGELTRLGRSRFERQAKHLENEIANRLRAEQYQRQAEAGQRTTLHQLQIVTDSMPAAVTRCSRDMRYLWVSKPYADWLRRPASEIVGRPLVEVVGQAAFDQLKPHFDRVLTGQQVRYEEAVEFRGIGLRWITAIYTPTMNGGGDVSGWVAVVIDIQDRKTAEQSLRRIEESLRKQTGRLRHLWDSASILLTTDEPDALLKALFARIAPTFGIDTYFNYMVNEAGTALRLESSMGIADSTAQSIRQLQFGQAVCGTVAKTRKSITATHIQQSDDPKVQLVKSFGIRAYTCNPLMAGDRLLGTLSFASHTRDSFDDDEIESLRTICHYVAFAYERLRFVRELREADRRKDEFLATLAHELRNPLAPIQNAVHFLRLKGPFDQDLENARSMVDRQVRHMTRLVDDLLDVSRITRGKIAIQRERLSLEMALTSAIEATRDAIESAGLELIVRMPQPPIYVDGDLTRLAQVFGNLLNNAAKYTDRGGRVWLTAEERGDDAVICVRDTGIGISPAQLPTLFDMFSQVDSALERSHGGLGIGLALVRQLVQMHRGSVEAKSDGLGKGSEFIVRLPIAAQPIRKIAAPQSTTAIATALQRRRILVADDNVDAATSLSMMLSLQGHEVRTVHDGKTAVEIAEEFHPEVMLLDIGMPRMNGYDVARQVRSQSWGHDVTLVAITGWGQEEDKRKAEDAGFSTHFTKPVDPAALNQLLSVRAARS